MQLYGGAHGSDRLVGGLATSGSAVLGAVVVPLLVGMLGEDAQTFELLGFEIRTETAVSFGLLLAGLGLHYYGVPWSTVVLNGSVGSFCAAVGVGMRELGQEMRPAS